MGVRAPSGGSVVGVDIGGSGIKGAPVDVAAGKPVTERAKVFTPSPATPAAVAAAVCEVLDQIDAGGPVGLTLPAVIRDGIVGAALLAPDA